MNTLRHLVITPDANEIDNDFTGAFEPESIRYKRYWSDNAILHDVRTVRINTRQNRDGRVEELREALSKNAKVDRLAIFGHGWKTGCQFGLSCATGRDRLNLIAFAHQLAQDWSTENLRIALYCCSTGASDDGTMGDNGFADQLRDALTANGRPYVQVFSHFTAGHTTRNANIRLFAGNGETFGGMGGVDPVKPGTPEFKRLYARLHDVKDPLRWVIPYLNPEEILAELK